MGVVTAVLIASGLWLVLGAMLHGRDAAAADAACEAWWWESSEQSAGIAWHRGLPASHPLAHPDRSPSQVG